MLVGWDLYDNKALAHVSAGGIRHDCCTASHNRKHRIYRVDDLDHDLIDIDHDLDQDLSDG